jgi:hypothetical protein
MDNRPEGLRPPIEPQKVAHGEWVRPLADITATPDALRGHEVRTKIIPLDLDGQALNIEMNAAGFDILPRLRVITPTGVEDMTGPQSKAWEERFGRQLFSVTVITADEKDYPDGLPIAVLMKTLQGEVYRNKFISSEGEAAYVDMAEWKKQGDTKEDETTAHFLLVPEIEAVLRNIEFKFDTIEDSK